MPPLSGPYQRKLVVPPGILGTQMYPFLSASTGQAAADQYVTNYSLCTPLESNFSSLVIPNVTCGSSITEFGCFDVFLNYQWDTRILNSTQEDILGDCAAFCWECCYLTTIALGQVYYHLEDETTLCSCMTISDPGVYDLISSK